MAIALPPPTPTRSQPASFSERMDAYLSWFSSVVPELNALAAGSTDTGNFNAINVTNAARAATFRSGAGTAAAVAVGPTADTNTGLFFPEANVMAVSTNGSEALRVTSTNALLIGATDTPVGLTGIPTFQTFGLSDAGQWLGMRAATANVPFELHMARSRGTTLATRYTSLVVGDYTGAIVFDGADGTSVFGGAEIRSKVTAISAGTVNGNLELCCGSGAGGAVATVMALTKDDVTFAQKALIVNGTAAAPGLAFVGDADNGIFKVATNSYGFSAGGVEVARVNANGLFVTEGKLGYLAAAGQGSQVTQTGTRTSPVTINTPAGKITLVTASLPGWQNLFTVNCSAVEADDLIILNQIDGSAPYLFTVKSKTNGSFVVNHASLYGTPTESVSFSYAIIKAAKD